jgi:hypothetical protein
MEGGRERGSVSWCRVLQLDPFICIIKVWFRARCLLLLPPPPPCPPPPSSNTGYIPRVLFVCIIRYVCVCTALTPVPPLICEGRVFCSFQEWQARTKYPR